MRVWLALILVCLATPAWAELTVYGHSGAWDLFRGSGTDGQQLCGIGHENTSTHEAFSLRYIKGGDGLVFVAAKPSWQIPDGRRVPVVMRIGSGASWTEQAVGHGTKLEWAMGRDQVPGFDTPFRQGETLSLSFPSGSEQPWTVSLSGSAAASTMMGRCITDMLQGGPAVAPAGPTQPFSQPR